MSNAMEIMGDATMAPTEVVDLMEDKMEEEMETIPVMQEEMATIPKMQHMPVTSNGPIIEYGISHPLDHITDVDMSHAAAPSVIVHTPVQSRFNNDCTLFAALPCLLIMMLMVFNIAKRLPSTGNKLQVSLWVIFAACFAFAFLFQPEAEDPSIVISFGAGFQMFSLALFWLLPRKAANPQATTGNGDSPPFAMLMMVCLILRLPCTLRYQGYLPTDQSGDGAYQLFEFTTLLLSIRGLARTGLTTRDGMYAAAAFTASVLLACVCYGDLDRRPAADRAIAASMYAEVCAWGFLVAATINAGENRTIPSGFLPPALAQACCRTYFWYLAAVEMVPLKPKLLMDYFPDAIVAVHFMICGFIGLATLLVCCPEKDNLVTPKVAAAAAEPFLSVVDDAAGAFEMAKGLVPVRAVWENGKMKVEYALPEKDKCSE